MKKRLQGVNTSCSEQVFSWFRNYARILNKMEPTVHYFLVLLFTKIHNEQVRQNTADYLNAHSARKETRASATAYECTRRRLAAAMSKETQFSAGVFGRSHGNAGAPCMGVYKAELWRKSHRCVVRPRRQQ